MLAVDVEGPGRRGLRVSVVGFASGVSGEACRSEGFKREFGGQDHADEAVVGVFGDGRPAAVAVDAGDAQFTRRYGS